MRRCFDNLVIFKPLHHTVLKYANVLPANTMTWKRTLAIEAVCMNREYCAGEDVRLKNEDLMGEMYKKYSACSKDTCHVPNNKLFMELIYILSTFDEQTSACLKHALNLMSVTLTFEDEVASRLIRFGVCSPLINILHLGPEDIKSEVALCLYHLNSRSIKLSGSAMCTFETYVVDNSTVTACVRPLADVIRDVHYPHSARLAKYSLEQQEHALDALLRYSLRNIKLTSVLLSEGVVENLIPILFSGNFSKNVVYCSMGYVLSRKLYLQGKNS